MTKPAPYSHEAQPETTSAASGETSTGCGGASTPRPEVDSSFPIPPRSNEHDSATPESSALYDKLGHPLLLKSVVLPTSAVADVITKVRSAAMLRQHSISFSGPSGSGKSQALRGVSIELRKHFPDVSIFTHHILNQPSNSTRGFFKHFLVTTQAGSTFGETYDLRSRLTNKLLESALLSRLKLVLMLIDESQQMTIEDFNFLKDVGNHLEFHGAHILVVMMAEEPTFQNVLSRLRQSDRKGLAARFALKNLEFKTMREREDYQSLFDLIDQQVFPLGSGISWPQFFAPISWRRGFRMRDQAEIVFELVESMLGDAHADQAVNLRQLFVAIRIMLLNLADSEASGDAWNPMDAWKTALDDALVMEAATVSEMSNAKKSRKAVTL